MFFLIQIIQIIIHFTCLFPQFFTSNFVFRSKTYSKRLKIDAAGSKDIEICDTMIVSAIFAKIVTGGPEVTKICDAMMVHVIGFTRRVLRPTTVASDQNDSWLPHPHPSRATALLPACDQILQPVTAVSYDIMLWTPSWRPRGSERPV